MIIGFRRVLAHQLFPDRQAFDVRSQRVLDVSDLLAQVSVIVRCRRQPCEGFGTGFVVGLQLLADRLEKRQRLFQQLLAQGCERGIVLEHRLLDHHISEPLDRVNGHRFAGRGARGLPGQFAVLASDDRGEGHRAKKGEHQHGRGTGHERAMPARPAAGAVGPWLAIGGYRLVGEPVLDVLGQRARTCITIRWIERHRFEADRIERFGNARIDGARRSKLATLDSGQDLGGIVAGKRGFSRHERVERRAQAVDVAARPEQVESPFGLLGAHVGRRAQGRSGECVARPAGRSGPQRRLGARIAGRWLAPADDLRQAPVDHQGLAIGTEQDITRLDVAMEHTPAVGVGDRIADIQKATEQPAQGERGCGNSPVRLAPRRRGGRDAPWLSVGVPALAGPRTA